MVQFSTWSERLRRGRISPLRQRFAAYARPPVLLSITWRGDRTAFGVGMTIGPLSSLYSSLLQPVASALGISKNSGSTRATGSVGKTQDNPYPPPPARILKSIQHLQQQAPKKSKQPPADIASHLKTEAAKATAAGNVTE